MRSKFKRALAFAASIAMCGTTLLHFPSGTFHVPIPASAAEGDACTESGCTGTFDANGFCTEDDSHYEAAPDSNGVYQISNAGQLYWFMKLINSAELDEDGTADADFDAILVNDITVNESVLSDPEAMRAGTLRAWFPIGYRGDCNEDEIEESVRYIGTFDGDGH